MSNGFAPAGLVPRKYKSGSIIYFEGDKSEYIYILKSGRVVLTSIKPDTGEEVKEEVRTGEFFGVKSSLGKYPREETAQTFGETVVLVMNLADFERLILRNVNVVRKMLRVFSNQLRRIHKMVRSVLGEGEIIKYDVELFRIGDYYFKAGVFKQAQYAFKKYLEHYPDSEYASQAAERIKAIETGKATAQAAQMAAKPAPVPVAEAKPKAEEKDDFTFEDVEEPVQAKEPKGEDIMDFDGDVDTKSDLSSEMDDFLSEPEKGGKSGGLDFSLDEAAGGSKIKGLYDKAEALYSAGDFAGALVSYEEIVSSPDVTDDDKNMLEDAHFYAGLCCMKTGNTRKAFDYFSKVVKQYPTSATAKESLYYMGEIFESAKQKDKALLYYQKVAGMAPRDEISTRALAKIKKLKG